MVQFLEGLFQHPGHCKDFINSIQPWFCQYDQDYAKMLPMQFVKPSMYTHFTDCFEAIFRGRNTLVLLTRKNELPHMRWTIQEIDTMIHTFMVQSGLYQQGSKECLNILQNDRLIDLTKYKFPKHDRPCFNLENDSTAVQMPPAPQTTGKNKETATPSS